MGSREPESSYLQYLIEVHHPFARSALELACGTGRLLAPLAPRYRVAGLDTSPAMLAQAKKRLPGVPFFRQDMRSFTLTDSYDVVFCVFNSLNHVLTLPGWQKVFGRAARHLRPLGVFIFEINTPKRLEADREPPPIVPFGPHWIQVNTTQATNGVSTLKIKLLEKRKTRGYRISETAVREKSFPPAEIRRALAPWFSSVYVTDPERRRPSPASDRLYFACHKRT